MHTLIDPATSYYFAQWAFIKLLGLTYLIAFGSLLVQVKGLYGSQGIVPLKEIFKGIRRNKAYTHFYYTPSLFWLSTSDWMLQGLAMLGVLGSILVLCGIATSVSLFVLFLLYLSYVSACIYFLSFQWDTLLIEVGFVGFLYSLQTPPLPIATFLLWLVLFRFIFSSGIVKFLMGSQEWRHLKALEYHYETQPLPNKGAYYANQQAAWVVTFSTLMVFIIEIVVPFFIFINAEMRLLAFACLVFLQIVIMCTGNYAFFNLLTIALCFPLIDDHQLPWSSTFFAVGTPPVQLVLSVVVSFTCMLWIVLNFFQFVSLFKPLPVVERVLRFFAPFYIINTYGLFSYMTTQRYEIEIEGSEDGETWKTYEFRWKPGNLSKAPRQVAPYQPRLDWQMWFASLGTARQNPWFYRLIQRLLDNTPDVVHLLKANPFPDQPPQYIRALLYMYKFTTWKEKAETGNWWKREYLRVYLPPTMKE